MASATSTPQSSENRETATMAAPFLRPAPSPATPVDAPDYAVATVREATIEDPTPEDGLLYPIPTTQANTVYAEPRDGSRLRFFDCRGIDVRVPGSRRPLLAYRRLRGRVMLSDARITVACSTCAAGHGTMLVGQVRYPWLHSVYAQNRDGLLGIAKLRLFVAVAGQALQVELRFPTGVDVTALGTELIHRAAAFRMAHDEAPLSAAEYRRMHELSALAPLVFVRGSGRMPSATFPSAWPASLRSARFGA
jgi:hypothetical protein